jgi:hypothetical protein
MPKMAPKTPKKSVDVHIVLMVNGNFRQARNKRSLAMVRRPHKREVGAMPAADTRDTRTSQDVWIGNSMWLSP